MSAKHSPINSEELPCTTYDSQHYNLPAILAFGFRVRTPLDTQIGRCRLPNSYGYSNMQR